MKALLALFLTSLLSVSAFAHGEDKPGPHGGFVRMPGLFHTEVAFDTKDDSFHLFLLDVEFKNPTVKNSSVEAVVEQGKKSKVSFSCSVMGGNHYHCKPQRPYSKSNGKLVLKATRDGAAGTAEYQFPLKFAEGTASSQKSSHDSHH